MADQHNSPGKICQQCGAVSPFSDDFCDECGARLPSVTVCPTCGEIIPPEEVFCSSCGTSVSPPQTPPPTMNTPPYPPPPVAPPDGSDIDRQQGGGTPVLGNGPRNFLIPVIIAVVIIGLLVAVVLVGIPGLTKPSGNITGNTSLSGAAMSRAFEGDWQVESAADPGSIELFRITVLPDNTITALFPKCASVTTSGALSDGGSTLNGTFSDTESGKSGTIHLVLSDKDHFNGTWLVEGQSYPISGIKGAPVSTSATNTVGSLSLTGTTGTQAATAPVSGIQADFRTDKTSGSFPLTVSFSDTSTGSPDQWYWDFGEGTYSNEKNPVHTFKSEGSFTVTLSVDRSGQTSSKSKVISASSLPPVANFVADTTSGKAPLTVSFTDTSTGSPTTWFWEFANGQISYDQNPETIYQEQGNYQVKLTVDRGGVKNTKSMIINVNAVSSSITAATTTVPATTISAAMTSQTVITTQAATSMKTTALQTTITTRVTTAVTTTAAPVTTVSAVTTNAGTAGGSFYGEWRDSSGVYFYFMNPEGDQIRGGWESGEIAGDKTGYLTGTLSNGGTVNTGTFENSYRGGNFKFTLNDANHFTGTMDSPMGKTSIKCTRMGG